MIPLALLINSMNDSRIQVNARSLSTKSHTFFTIVSSFVGVALLLLNYNLLSYESLSQSTVDHKIQDVPQFANPTSLIFEGKRDFTDFVNTSSYQHRSNKTRGIVVPHSLYVVDPIEMEIIPRAFVPLSSETPLPCLPAEKDWKNADVQHTPSKEGFLYLKPHKTGSSTCAGMNLRISRNVAKRQTSMFDMCKTRHMHGRGSLLFKDRIRDRSFLWTIIRDPKARSISSFFHFGVSRRDRTPKDKYFQRYITKRSSRDYYLNYMYTGGFVNREVDDPVEVANAIVREYDFIGVLERMEESSVALMMLLNLKLADILYLRSKTNGGYDAGGRNGCTYIAPSFVTHGMKKFFKSDEWNDFVKYDLALYHAVNKSLDMTIDILGRDLFQENLEKFKIALGEAESKCLPTAVFPCDQNGTFHSPSETDCLWSDSGCGTTCLDQVATDLGLWQN